VWPRKSSKTQPAKEPKPAKKPKPAAASVKRQPSAPADVYTVFLAIALVAVLVAILFLCLEMSPYEFKFQGGPPVTKLDGQATGNRGLCVVGETRPAASLAARVSRSTMILR
jgi:hypothetical protein